MAQAQAAGKARHFSDLSTLHEGGYEQSTSPAPGVEQSRSGHESQVANSLRRSCCDNLEGLEFGMKSEASVLQAGLFSHAVFKDEKLFSNIVHIPSVRSSRLDGLYLPLPRRSRYSIIEELAPNSHTRYGFSAPSPHYQRVSGLSGLCSHATQDAAVDSLQDQPAPSKALLVYT